MGIKKRENEIISAAKNKQKHIKETQRKLKEGQLGGQISNQLRNMSEANIKYKIQQLNTRNKEEDEAKKAKAKEEPREKKKDDKEIRFQPVVLPAKNQELTQQIIDDVQPVFIQKKPRKKKEGAKKKENKAAAVADETKKYDV